MESMFHVWQSLRLLTLVSRVDMLILATALLRHRVGDTFEKPDKSRLRSVYEAHQFGSPDPFFWLVHPMLLVLGGFTAMLAE